MPQFVFQETSKTVEKTQQDWGISLPTEQATRNLGRALGQVLGVGSILLLQGDLGSGKTTLVQGIGQGLGIDDLIVSPTFILLNEYTEGRIPLYHFDLYRLDPKEVEALHLEVYWEGLEYPPGIVAIEWAERLPYHPADSLKVQLTLTESTGRQAVLSPMEKFPAALRQALNSSIKD